MGLSCFTMLEHAKMGICPVAHTSAFCDGEIDTTYGKRSFNGANCDKG